MSRTALYRHFDASGQLLYVGISLNAVNRLAQHRNSARWFGQIARIEVQWLGSRAEALMAEAQAISQENPIWNIARPVNSQSTERRAIPIPSATNYVRVRGEELGEVLWQGRQWAVTDRGIECRDGTYFIAKHRLHQDEPVWSWRKQMAEKDWVDQEDFALAFSVACWAHLGERIHLSEALAHPHANPRKRGFRECAEIGGVV